MAEFDANAAVEVVDDDDFSLWCDSEDMTFDASEMNDVSKLNVWVRGRASNCV